jgi:predicted DNA-binding protein (MmcQ/YjbR family)
MVTFEQFRTLALSFPHTEEQPHFEKPSYRHNGKIFATYHADTHRAMLKLTPIQQSVYHAYNPGIFIPVPGAWGAKGYTLVEISKVPKDIFKEALIAAYEGVAAKVKKK